MKLSVLLTFALLCALIAGLVITNPGPEAYVEYATVQASSYLSEEICNDLPAGLGGLLTEQCPEIMLSVEPQLETILRDRTERLNIGIASLYRTSFGIPEFPFLPEYRAETIGIVNQFLTYRVAKIA